MFVPSCCWLDDRPLLELLHLCFAAQYQSFIHTVHTDSLYSKSVACYTVIGDNSLELGPLVLGAVAPRGTTVQICDDIASNQQQNTHVSSTLVALIAKRWPTPLGQLAFQVDVVWETVSARVLDPSRRQHPRPRWNETRGTLPGDLP